MALLFVNACMRKDSRTMRLARRWLEGYEGEVTELRIASMDLAPLNDVTTAAYGEAVAMACYDDPLFDFAKQFAQADDVLIAAPFWNFSIPAKLHDYLELVCSQGVTFDISDTGAYVSLCRARSLTFVCTMGGVLPGPEADHAFGYVKTLAKEFWHIPEVRCIMVDGLDAVGTDVEAKLAAAL